MARRLYVRLERRPGSLGKQLCDVQGMHVLTGQRDQARFVLTIETDDLLLAAHPHYR